MKPIFLLVCLLMELALNLSLAHGLPGSATTPTPRHLASTLGITVAPVSVTYTVGQTVLLTMTGGSDGINYSVNLFDDTDSPVSATLRYVSAQGTNNAFLWPTGASSYTMAVTFGSDAASPAANDRYLSITNLSDQGDYANTGSFQILPKPTLTLVISPTLTTYNTGQSVTATVTGGIVGEIYTVKLYKNTPDDANDLLNFIRPTNSQGGTAAIVWGPTTSSEQFYVQFVAGSEGPTQLLEITNLDFLHTVDSPTFSITACSIPVNITAAPSQPITPGGSVTLTASGATSYTWSNGSTQNPLVLTNVTSAITLSVRGVTGECSGTASAAVTLDCDPTIVADAVSIKQTALLGPANCSVELTGTGFGTGYTIRGPNGYVFSAVYRKVGYYNINALNVKLPGTYTLTVSYTNACGQSSFDTMTYVVGGEACP